MLTTLSECEPSWERARSWDELVEVVTQVEVSAGKAREPALQNVCCLLRERLHDLKATVAEPTHQHRALLRYGSRLIRAYLEGTDRADAIDVLVTVLQHPAWVNPLNDSEAKALREMLSAPPSLERPSPVPNEDSIGPEHELDTLSSSEQTADAEGSTQAGVLSPGAEDEASGPGDEDRGPAPDTDTPMSAYTADAPPADDPNDTADASGKTQTGRDDAPETSDDHEIEADAVSVDYTVEPDDPFDETLDTLPGDDTAEPEKPPEQTVEAPPGDDGEADAVSADDSDELRRSIEQSFALSGGEERVAAGTESVDETVEPEDPPEQTFHAPRAHDGEADAVSADDSDELRRSIEQSFALSDGEERVAAGTESVDETVEPEDPPEQSLEAPPGDDGEADAVSVDYTVEPEDPFDETLDALPGDDAVEPEDPPEHTVEALPGDNLEASTDAADERLVHPETAQDDLSADGVLGVEPGVPAGQDDPAAPPEGSREPEDSPEASYEDLAEDDEDVAAHLIRELRAEAAAAAGHAPGAPDGYAGESRDPASDAANEASLGAESTDRMRSIQSLAEGFDDPGQAEADLEALYSGDSQIDTGAIDHADERGEKIAHALDELGGLEETDDDGGDSGALVEEIDLERPDWPDYPEDGPEDGVPEERAAEGGDHLSLARVASELRDESMLPFEATASGGASENQDAHPQGVEADTGNGPEDDPPIDTLTGALDGLAEEYGEVSDPPVEIPTPDATPPTPSGPPGEDAGAEHDRPCAAPREAETPDASGDTLWSGEGWSEAVREMVQLLMAELTEINTSLTECVQIATREDASAEERRAAIAHAREQFDRFGGAAEVIGFEGLNRLCKHIHENLSALERSGAALGPDLAELLRTWSDCARAYLSDPDDTAACATLARYACDGQWPEPVDDVDELVETLVSPKLSLGGEGEPAGRATEACAADVSLDTPPDVDAALLEGLLQELPTQTAEFTRSIQHLITGDSLEDVDVAQRVAHTLKGAANTVGVPGIANLTHHLEDILLALAKHETLPGRALGDTLLGAADCLEMMSEALLEQGPGPDEPVHVLQDVLDWANRIDREGIEAARAGDAPPSSAPPEPSPEPAARPPTQPPAEASPEPLPEAEADTGVHPKAAETPTAPIGGSAVLRVRATIVDEILRLVGETIILTGQVQERVQRAVGQMRGMHGQFQLLQQLGHELEQLIDLRDVTLPQQRAANADFDPLELDQYNELHTCSRRLVEAATDSREMGRDIEEVLASLDDLLTEQSRLNRESQEAVLHTRMIAVQSIVPRLQRSVRQAGRVAGKSVTLECLGTDTLMDGDVLNELVDPLAHILRNSVDHGIDSEAERRAAGKEPGGQIRVEFQREGNHVVVRCADDGRGLDWDSIRRVAEHQGLIAPEQEVSEDELKRLILRPNFTTRAQTTQLSGRGIGMDAVQARVSQLGGSLNLRSEAGKGCTVELRLPLTLISTHALLVRTARYVFAVSNRGVEQIVHGSLGEEVHMGTGMSFHFEDNIYPLTSLETLLGLPEDRRAEERHPCPVLLVQGKAGMHAVKVDAVLDSRDLVVKSLGRFVPKLRGIAGATILGDGSVSTVVDLPELLSIPARALAPHVEEDDLEGTQKVRVGLPIALVVDDSLSARRSLSQVMGDSGFEVRTARDGLEAIDVIEGQRPDVVLVDLEMPRMNGLELIQHLRAREDTRNLPIVMITSRATEKHRRQAEAAGVTCYLTKPFAEDELLERVTASFR